MYFNQLVPTKWLQLRKGSWPACGLVLCVQQEGGVRDPRAEGGRRWVALWQRCPPRQAGGEGLCLGAVGRAGRFGGLCLEKKTHLCKGL